MTRATDEKPRRHPRAQSQPAVDRDKYVPKHPTPASGVPESWDDDCTGKYEEGEALQRAREERAARDPAGRIAKLEAGHKELAGVVTGVRVDVGKMTGKIDTMLDYASKADTERERRAKADAVSAAVAVERRRKYVIALISALGTAVAVVAAAMAGGRL